MRRPQTSLRQRRSGAQGGWTRAVVIDLIDNKKGEQLGANDRTPDRPPLLLVAKVGHVLRRVDSVFVDLKIRPGIQHVVLPILVTRPMKAIRSTFRDLIKHRAADSVLGR